MHELPWITIFGSRVCRFANNFHEWRSHEWKLLANRITSDPKSLFMVTIFGSRVCRFANNFHEWRSHEWKLLANRITSDPKSLFMVTNVFFYFLRAILCPWTHDIADFAIVARDGLFWFSNVTSLQLFCDVTRMRVTGMWRHIRRLFLHAQIGAKAIFASE